MVDSVRELIGAEPILAIFLAVGLGYAVGQISILGFSLGVGAVLFVGLFIGAIAPKANIAGPIGLVGLIMFLYGIGILYGRQFFEGLSGPGRTYNLLALVAVVTGLLVALLFGCRACDKSTTTGCLTRRSNCSVGTGC
jgi:putative transport protein